MKSRRKEEKSTTKVEVWRQRCRKQIGAIVKEIISERVREIQVQEQREEMIRYNMVNEWIEISWLPRYLTKKWRRKEATISAQMWSPGDRKPVLESRRGFIF